MSEFPLFDKVRSVASVLAEPLTEAFSTSVGQVENMARPLPHSTHPSIRPGLMRAYLREVLNDMPLPEKTCLGGNPALNSQLSVIHDGFELRVLKENRNLFTDGIPVAGRNAARQAYYSQPPLDPSLPSSPNDQTKLLLLWNWKDVQEREQGVTLRIVHTTGTGSWYRKAVPIDLSIPVRSELDYYDNLSFRIDERLEDFFPNIAKAENEMRNAI